MLAVVERATVGASGARMTPARPMSLSASMSAARNAAQAFLITVFVGGLLGPLYAMGTHMAGSDPWLGAHAAYRGAVRDGVSCTTGRLSNRRSHGHGAGAPSLTTLWL